MGIIINISLALLFLTWGSATSQILQNCFPGLCASGIGKTAEVEFEISQVDYLESYLKNLNLDSNAPVESKHQELNRIYLEHFAAWSNSLDSADMAQLLALAHECPYEGGQAVYQARTLVELVQPGEQYDDDCMQALTGGGNRLAAPESLESAVENVFVLFPNPTEGSFAVAGRLQKSGVVQVLDVHGRVVKEARIEAGEFNASLQMDPHSDGIYFVRIIDHVGVVWTSKLLLQRK